MQKEKKLWFRRKDYGWGWYPSCIEGWAAIFGFFIAVVLSAIIISGYTIDGNNFAMVFVPTTIILALILIIISFLRGEKPCWCWHGKPVKRK